MSGTHGVFQHRTGYFYTTLQEDFCEMYKGKGNNEVCRAYITSILENLTNRQFDATGSDEDIWVYMSLPEMARRMRHAYSERTIHKELQGMIKDGYLQKRRAIGKATMEYCLNIKKIRSGLASLPEPQPCNSATYNLANLQEPSSNSARSTLQNYKNDLAELQPRISNRLNIDETENNESTDASAIAPAAPTPFSSQQQQAEPIRIATSEQEDNEKAGQHGLSDRANNSHDNHTGRTSVQEARPQEAIAPKASVSEQEDVPPDENENHSQESTQENSVGMVPHGRAKAVPPQEQKTPPKPRRTPPVHKDGVPTPERIEQVFVCMEGTIRRLTEQEDFTFGRTKKAKEAIKDLLQGRTVSQEKMDWHIVRLWHKPKDTKTGFWWRENMSVVAICNNYDREIVNYRPGAPGGASASTDKPRPTALVSEEQARKNIDKMRQRVAAMQAAAAAK